MIRNNHVAGGGDDDHDDDDDDDEPCSQWYLKSEQHLPFFFKTRELLWRNTQSYTCRDTGRRQDGHVAGKASSVIFNKYSFDCIFWSLNVWPFWFLKSFTTQLGYNKNGPCGKIIPYRNWSFGLFAKKLLEA